MENWLENPYMNIILKLSSARQKQTEDELNKLEAEIQKPDVWADQKKASDLGAKSRSIKDNLEF